MRIRTPRMVGAAQHEAREDRAPARTPRVVTAVHHEPHEVDDASELMDHLVEQHAYSSEQLRGGARSFLVGVHLRGHLRMADDSSGTVPELAGSAERLFATAAETLEEMLPLDRDLALRLAARWGDTLTALGR